MWCSIHHILSCLISLALVPQKIYKRILFKDDPHVVEILSFFTLTRQEASEKSLLKHRQLDLSDWPTEENKLTPFSFASHFLFLGIAHAHRWQAITAPFSSNISILYATSFGFLPFSTCLCKCWWEYLSFHSISLWLMYAAPHTQPADLEVIIANAAGRLIKCKNGDDFCFWVQQRTQGWFEVLCINEHERDLEFRWVMQWLPLHADTPKDYCPLTCVFIFQHST